MGKYADALDSIDPMGRQNRIKRGLEREIRQQAAAKRVRFADIGDDYTMTPEGPQEVVPLPLPDGLTITAGMEQIEVVWSGSASAPVPADFDRLAVHVSKVAGYTPTAGTEVVAIGSPTGGVVTYEADPEPYYVRCALVSLRGVYGPFTDELAVTPAALSVDAQVLDIDRAAVTKSGNQLIPHASRTDLTFGVVARAYPTALFDNAADAFVVQTAGWYDVKFNADWATFLGGEQRIAYIAINGVIRTSSNGGFVAWEGALAVGDVVDFSVQQNSGAAVDVLSRGTFASITMRGPQ